MNTRIVSPSAATAAVAELQRGSSPVKQITVLSDAGAFLPAVVLGDAGQERMRGFIERHRGETVTRQQGSARWDFTLAPAETERSFAVLTLTSREFLREFAFALLLNLASDRAVLESLAASSRLAVVTQTVQTSAEARLLGTVWQVLGSELLVVLAQN